ncbi:MAG: DUF4139 domain-containing protein [Bacteroidia bacterium]|nr:DUF4139 domain-containing protein [Bacteroidia bacterium]
MAKLWIWLGLLWAQPLLPLSRLQYYSSGRAYWIREAVVPMLRSTVAVRLQGKAQPLFILHPPEYRIKRWSFVADTLLVEGGRSAETISQFLTNHIGASVWITYSAGAEWEEVQGILEKVSEQGDILLRRPSQERLWLPHSLVQAARIEGSATPKRNTPAWRVFIETDTTLPAARIIVGGWDSLAPWTALHTLQLTSPTRATLTTYIQIPSFAEEAAQVDLHLVQAESDSTQTYSWHLPMQKLSAQAENRVFLLRAEVPYTELYRASLPDLIESLDPIAITSWRGYAERSLQILNVSQTTIPAGAVHILDEQGLAVAQSRIGITPPAGSGYIPLAHMAGIELRLQEQETRRERLKDPAYSGKVILTGTLRIQNSSSREARLLVQKPITGQPLADRLGFARAAPLPERRGPNPRYLLQWELLLRPGAIETLEYAYEITLPASSR